MEQLVKQIQDLLNETKGTWGIHLEDLVTKETWAWNEQEVFFAASIIKVPIMAAVFAGFDEGLYRLSDTISLKREDQVGDPVGGCGVLHHLTPGINLTIYDYITLMIIQSDNTATNVLIDLVGVEKIQQIMKEIGMEQSSFHTKLMTVPVKAKGRNRITAFDIATLLKKLTSGSIISQYACEQMIDIMKKQHFRDCLPERFPDEESNIIGAKPPWEFANKTGWVTGIRHDIGILYFGKKAMNIVVLSKDVEDREAKAIMAQIGEYIFHYLKQ
ncbi:serine hydrolase [Bacillus sp. FJAT-49736]|uniref:serine hydrolase n=1 Tax=Bacillus sp. FJAT-49736 TaxID=2833582 RepID=UPI001BC9349C|nr:serine hydrolase [Bacillus sp. FJAT-49736]MBS4172887.1 serine hydrolase [Bacillus sp. FJAT-49736]